MEEEVIPIKSEGLFHFCLYISAKFDLELKNIILLFFTKSCARRPLWKRYYIQWFHEAHEGALGTTSKPNRRLTGSSVRFWSVSIVINNGNRPEPEGTTGQPAVGFWSRPLTYYIKIPGGSLSHKVLPTRVHTPPNWPLNGVMHPIKFCTLKWHHSRETYPSRRICVNSAKSDTLKRHLVSVLKLNSFWRFS